MLHKTEVVLHIRESKNVVAVKESEPETKPETSPQMSKHVKSGYSNDRNIRNKHAS